MTFLISVRTAYELDQRIPEDIYKHLPKTCIYCKSPIVMNDNYTSMRCSNSKCSGHMSHRASQAMDKLGVKEFGPATCLDIIQKNNHQHHLDLVNISLPDLPDNMHYGRKERLIHHLGFDKHIDLPVLLELCQIDGIAGKTAERVIGDYNSFEQFFTEHPTYENILTHFNNTLKRRKVTRNTVRLAYKLWLSKDDLLRVEKYFNINKRADTKLVVCMTGDIVTATYNSLPVRPRSKFIELLNLKYQNVATFINSEKSIAGSDILLTDSSKRTKKYNYAKNNNMIVSTFGGFIQMLNETLGEGNPDIKIDVRRDN